MKRFSNYQHVKGEPMNERDKKEVGSKFWNKGKWDNFVLPFLPNGKEMTLIDIGCNAGVFLKLAEDRGFSRVIGVDADREAVQKARRYKERVGGKFDVHHWDMKKCIDKLPVADYTVLAMTHYYFPVHHWLEYMDKLAAKTRYCIIVTAKKSKKYSKASADTEDIRHYFRNWTETDMVPELPFDDDPFPRHQWSFCFKSPLIERVTIESLNNGNHVQKGFWKDIDKGKKPQDTRYYKILRKYRRKTWSKERLDDYIKGKVETYNDVKKNGLKDLIIINSEKRIMDGNHRAEMAKHLGYKTVLARTT